MAAGGPVVLILGSAPNAVSAADWPRSWFDRIVAINNAWRVRPDWDTLIYPEDFPEDRRPGQVASNQRLIEAGDFVPAQNAYGGFVHGGATMAFTAGYWALAALRPRILAFMGCDLVYPARGPTHFYGTGAPDPLRPDVSLRDLGARSARLALIAAHEGCACVNLSRAPSALLFPQADPGALRGRLTHPDLDRARYAALRAREDALGYATPDGRHDDLAPRVDLAAMALLDRDWRDLLVRATREP